MKYIAYLFIIISISLGITSYYLYNQLNKIREISNDKILYLNDNIASLKTKVSKQDNIIKALNKTGLKEHISNDKIFNVSTITTSVETDNRKSDKPDYEFKDEYKFYELRFKDGPPIGYVIVYKDGSHVSKIYEHEILINNVVSQDKDTGKIKSHASANLVLKKSGLASRKNSKLKDWKGKPYPLKIKQGETIFSEEKVVSKKFRVRPIPSLNGTVRTNKEGKVDVAPSIGVAIASYGNKSSPDWKFVNTSIGYNKKVFAEVSPVMKKVIGNNTYVGPSVSIDEDLDIKVGATISLNF